MDRRRASQFRRIGAVALVAIVATVAIVACSAGPGASPPPATGAASSSGAAATTRVSAVASGAAIVTGTHKCGEVVSGTDTPVGDIYQRRGQIFRCTWEVSDARMSGTGVTLISADIADIVNDAPAVFWAEDMTWNEAGTWVGRVTGTKDAAGVHSIRTTALGTGSYAGLQYTDFESGAGDTWPVNGRIEPVSRQSPPAVTVQPSLETPAQGSGTCHEALAGTFAGSGHVRAWVFDCEIVSADPRVAGRQLILVNAEVHADGTASLWGTTVIWNDQGTWDGSWTGTAAAGWPDSERTWSGALVGSDGYRGMEYRVVTATWNGARVVMNGSIARV